MPSVWGSSRNPSGARQRRGVRFLDIDARIGNTYGARGQANQAVGVPFVRLCACPSPRPREGAPA